MTTKATLEQRRSECHLAEMPQTFVDAITVAGHLGIRYLWIDSLCICQDDADDWARESARMCDIYSNAHLVIAANRSDNSAGGCFHVREPRRHARFKVPDITESIHAVSLFLSDQEFPASDAEFAEEPLSQRGW